MQAPQIESFYLIHRAYMTKINYVNKKNEEKMQQNDQKV